MEFVNYDYVDTWSIDELQKALQEATERRDRAILDMGVLATEIARREPVEEWSPPI
jgi:hypothetical protein